MNTWIAVNGRKIAPDELLRHASMQEPPAAILEELIERVLLREYAAGHGVAVTPAELQQAADEMRYDRGLRTADQTVEWLRARGQTLESVQAGIEALLIRNKVMDSIPEQEIEAFYQEHRADLETVVLFSLRAASLREAEDAHRSIQTGAQFPAVAAAVSRDETTRASGGFVGRLRRADISHEIASAVFAVEPGAIVGPLLTEKGYNLFMAAERRLPSFDEEKDGIRILLFREMVARLRSVAAVEFAP